MIIEFGKRIRELRHKAELSQEQLAEKFGVSVQAVSKWECSQSYPDIELMKDIAGTFGVTVDYLLNGEKQYTAVTNYDFPDDGKLRIVQFKGNKLLHCDEYDPNVMISVDTSYVKECAAENLQLDVEIWGSARIDGDLYGNVSAGGSVTCDNINGGVNAGGGISCDNINGRVNAGGGISCDNISGGVNAGGGVNCENVSGSVNAGGNESCGDVGGNVSSGGKVECGDIDGNAEAKGDINCGDIEGNAKSDGNITCGDIEGDVFCKGNIRCEDIEGSVTCEKTVEFED